MRVIIACALVLLSVLAAIALTRTSVLTQPKTMASNAPALPVKPVARNPLPIRS